jgi:hypothetical protein
MIINRKTYVKGRNIYVSIRLQISDFITHTAIIILNIKLYLKYF